MPIHNLWAICCGHPRLLTFYCYHPDRVDMGHDVRNGPTRVREQPYEQQYREMVARGEFAPVFKAPRG